MWSEVKFFSTTRYEQEDAMLNEERQKFSSSATHLFINNYTMSND